MIHYRSFRNTDPPALVRLWNESLAGRATVPLRNTSLLEYFLLAKSYFDPAGLILAEDDGQLVGMALAGFGPDAARKHADTSTGILCVLGVLPSHRRRGVGTELLRRSEDYLRRRGATTLLAGPMTPANPFTFGLYGGSQSPGFLESNETIGPFLLRQGYAVADTVYVMQRHLDRPFNIIDGRFPALRKRFDVKALPRKGAAPWYEECVRGPLEFLGFGVENRATGAILGRANLWEMEPFSLRWNESAVGILDICIDESVRRQGVARLLLGNILRFLHDQYFTLIETQVRPAQAAGLALMQGLGFQQIDTGHVYRRQE